MTTRRFLEKDAWVAEKKAEGIWGDVRIIDADVLASWLEQAPSVRLWFSIYLGKHPAGLTDLDTFWSEWSCATLPPVDPDLVTAGRGEAVDNLVKWLADQPSVLGVQGESQDEALAFVAATLSALPEAEKARARSVVVETVDAWRMMVVCPSPLFLVPMFADRSIVNAAIQRGHHVLLPLEAFSKIPTATDAQADPGCQCELKAA